MITNVLVSRVTNWPLFWTLNLLAGVLVLTSGLSHPFVPGLIVAAVVVLIANLTVASVRTTVGPGGVAVYYGVFGWPRFRYSLGAMARAEAADLPLHKMGGWGVHWSPWRGTRLTIRSGPVLVLHRDHGRPVTVNCNDPHAAADLINHHQTTTRSRR